MEDFGLDFCMRHAILNWRHSRHPAERWSHMLFYFHRFIYIFFCRIHTGNSLLRFQPCLIFPVMFCGSVGCCLQGMQEGESHCREHKDTGTGGSNASLVSDRDSATLSFKMSLDESTLCERPLKISIIWGLLYLGAAEDHGKSYRRCLGKFPYVTPLQKSRNLFLSIVFKWGQDWDMHIRY